MKQGQNHISDDLLVKFLLGEASTGEIEEVNNWLTLSEANRKYFENFALIWETSKKIELKSTANENEAWERFKQKTQTTKPLGKTISFTPQLKWFRVAAVLLLLIGAGWTVSRVYESMQITSVYAANGVMNCTLPDGSTVTLNKSATLHYPKAFNGDTRTVKLEGEAFFNVTPDKSKPFIISTNDVKIRVVGTSFNVKSNDEKVEVIVETGIVNVAKNKNAVTLNPNEKAVVLNNSNKPVKQELTDELYNYYRTREFICNGTPLWRMVDVLNEVYNANIIIANPKIKDLPLTTTFHNETLDSILSVIAETLNVKVEHNGNEIIIK